MYYVMFKFTNSQQRPSRLLSIFIFALIFITNSFLLRAYFLLLFFFVIHKSINNKKCYCMLFCGKYSI